MSTISYQYKLYNKIKKADLPIEFVYDRNLPRFDNLYFHYKDILILCNFCPCYDEEKGLWRTDNEDEFVELENALKDDLEHFNQLQGREVCRRAIVLKEIDPQENTKPYLQNNEYIVFHGMNCEADALQAFIEAYEQADIKKTS